MNKFSIAAVFNKFLLVESVNVDENIFKFNDGSLRVTLPKEILFGAHSLEYAGEIIITAYLESLDDLMVVSQIVDIIRRNTRVAPDIKLSIVSTMYSRYDRVMLKERTDGFGLLTFVKFIKATGVNSVKLLDPHSALFGRLLDTHGLEVTVTSQHEALQDMLKQRNYIRIYPDKGSLEKRDRQHPYAPVIFDKVRDVSTGKIEGIYCIEGQGVLSNQQGAPFLIVDDICEGGGTFLGIAKEFWKLSHSANELNLYVTHGLFTKNAIVRLIEDGGYSHIYAHIMKRSTYDEIPEQYKSRVTVHNIVEGI